MPERRIGIVIKNIFPKMDDVPSTTSMAISGGVAGGVLLGPIGIGPGIAVGVATERTISLLTKGANKKKDPESSSG